MRKLFVFLMLFSAAGVFAQLDTLFYDDFSDNSNQWLTGESNGNIRAVEDGFYKWERTEEGNWSTWDTWNQLNDEEFLIECGFNLLDGGAFGIMWGAAGVDNAYIVTVDDDNEMQTFMYSREDYFSVTDKFEIPDFDDDAVDKITIHKKGNKLFYYFNGQLVLEEFFSGFYGRNVGFWVEDEMEVEIDYLLIEHHINLVPNLVYTDVPENLGANVNTEYSDISPVVTPDGKGLYITLSEAPQNVGGVEDYSDIFYSTFENGAWTKAVNIGFPLNNTSSNSVNSVTPDGNMLFLINQYDEDGNPNGGGASVSYRTEDGWSIPADIDIIDHYNLADYNEWTMSNDRQVIIYAIQRNDTFGERDLYVTFNMGNGKWSAPLNLGNVVNTPFKEMSPFIASDSKTLYFSSNGHPGYGSNDIFLTKRLDDSWTNWSKPQNVGKPINSDDWDAYYSVPASGEYAYFVSAKSGFGESDIFRIKLPETVKPTPVVLISGAVLNAKTKEPLQAAISYFDLSNGVNAGSAASNPSDGSYKIILPAGKKYGFLAAAESYLSVSENMDLTGLDKYEEINKDLMLVPIEVGQAVRLNNIFFESGSAELLSESFIELDKLVQILKDNSGMNIQINGHTDNVGNDDHNMTLSQQRAASVVTYLISKGVDAERLDSKGFGETQPVAPNDTDEGRALNRRVEFVITDY